MRNANHVETGRHKPYEPTRREIRNACESLQSSWSERERRKRAGEAANACWLPPSVTMTSLDDAASESQTDVASPIGETSRG